MTKARWTLPGARPERETTAARVAKVSPPDDGQRGSVGVSVSLLSRGDGTTRVLIDDVAHDGAGRWAPVGHFTCRDYPQRDLEGVKIPARDLQHLGYLVLVRLLAASGRLDRD